MTVFCLFYPALRRFHGCRIDNDDGDDNAILLYGAPFHSDCALRALEVHIKQKKNEHKKEKKTVLLIFHFHLNVCSWHRISVTSLRKKKFCMSAGCTKSHISESYSSPQATENMDKTG